MKKLQKMSLHELTSSTHELTMQEASSLIAGCGQTLSNSGMYFLKGWEGYNSAIYDDNGSNPGGTLTVGWGHTVTAAEQAMIGSGQITDQQAQAFFDADVQRAVNLVNNNVSVELTQDQFDALVSYVFNTGSLVDTKLLAALNSGDFETACSEMDINTQDGIYVQGLEDRRASERDVFTNGYW